MMAWVDNWSYLSNISLNNNFWAKNTYLKSNELVLPMVNNELSHTPELNSYTVGSNYVYRDTRLRESLFSDIEWHKP